MLSMLCNMECEKREYREYCETIDVLINFLAERIIALHIKRKLPFASPRHSRIASVLLFDHNFDHNSGLFSLFPICFNFEKRALSGLLCILICSNMCIITNSSPVSRTKIRTLRRSDQAVKEARLRTSNQASYTIERRKKASASTCGWRAFSNSSRQI